MKFAVSSSNLVDRHKSFYQTELARKESTEREKDADELIPSGTKSRPQKLPNITGYTLLVKHMTESIPPLAKLIKNPVDGHLWALAATAEINSLLEKGTFTVVDGVPSRSQLIISGYVCKEKLGANNEIVKRKVRIVAHGNKQDEESFGGTFAPVTDITEILAVLAIAAKRNWPVHQLDVKSAYLNAPIHHDIYMKLPADVPDPTLRGAIVKLNKALYGLKQAGFEWYHHLKKNLLVLNWRTDDLFPCRFKRTFRGDPYIMLVYVDDIIITGPDVNEIINAKKEINNIFEIDDLGEISYLLGMRVIREPNYGAFILDQEALISRLVSDFGITGLRSTPCSTDVRKLTHKGINDPKVNVREFQSKVGSLMYISRYTRPEINYISAFLSRFQGDPRQSHMDAANRVIYYLNQTMDSKLNINPHKTKIKFGN